LDAIAEHGGQRRHQFQAQRHPMAEHSGCTSWVTSLIASLISSATFCVSVFLESARSRWMISLAACRC